MKIVFHLRCKHYLEKCIKHYTVSLMNAAWIGRNFLLSKGAYLNLTSNFNYILIFHELSQVFPRCLFLDDERFVIRSLAEGSCCTLSILIWTLGLLFLRRSTWRCLSPTSLSFTVPRSFLLVEYPPKDPEPTVLRRFLARRAHGPLRDRS